MHPLLSKHLATYAPEDCATCKGSGKLGIKDPPVTSPLLTETSILNDEKRAQLIALYSAEDYWPECEVCGGRGIVLALQPSRKCPHCAGDGRGLQPRCLQCRGTGWMLVWKAR